MMGLILLSLLLSLLLLLLLLLQLPHAMCLTNAALWHSPIHSQTIVSPFNAPLTSVQCVCVRVLVCASFSLGETRPQYRPCVGP